MYGRKKDGRSRGTPGCFSGSSPSVSTFSVVRAVDMFDVECVDAFISLHGKWPHDSAKTRGKGGGVLVTPHPFCHC